MNKRQKIIVSITGIFIVLLALIGLTYAYFLTQIKGNEETKSISVTTADLRVEYQDGEATFSTGNEDELIYPGFWATKKFSVENTGTKSVNYSVILDNVENEFEREDWEYSLAYGDETVTGKLKINPYQTIAENVSINPGEKINFVLTLTYKEMNVDQSVDMGKSLSLRVNIEEIPTVLGISQFKRLVDANGVITLTGNTVLSAEVWLSGEIQMLDSSVKVIDLNGYTLTVNPDFSHIAKHYEGAYSVIAATPLEIKNGTIRRGEDLTSGSILLAYGINSKVTLTNVTVDGNKVLTDQNRLANDGIWFEGAGIACVKCVSLTIKDSEIINNYGTGSGIGVKALENDINTTLTINNSVIKNNKLVRSSDQSGSAILASISTVNIAGTTIENNVADASLGTVDLSDSGNVTIDENTIIRNNVATQAGGLYLRDVRVGSIYATIEGNKATNGNGGGVYTLLNDSTYSIVFHKATIRNNSAAAGGGVYVNGPTTGVPGTVSMFNPTITGNIAYGTPATGTLKDGGGAGIYVSRGIATIMNGSIENNISTSGIGNAIVVSHAGRNNEGGKLTIAKSEDHSSSIIGSVAVPSGYGTLTLIGATQNGDLIS